MAQSDLRRQLEQLAQQFVDGVLRAIRSAPLAEIAGAEGAPRVGAPRERVPAGARRASGRATTSAAAAPVATGGRRQLVRRSADEIESVRVGILEALRGLNSPVSASEIARRIGGGVRASDLAFPMNKLREAGLVRKDGERTQAVYALAERARAGGKKGSAKGAGERGGAKGAGEKSGAKGAGKKQGRKKR